MAPTLNINHAKMQAVVNRLDRLLESLNSSGNSGSYAGLTQASQVAQAVCSVAEPEMATFVNKYNEGFGAAANQYRSLCDTLVTIRNAVAKTANIHLDNDAVQSKAFDPLKTDGLTVKDHHSTLTDSNGDPVSTPGSGGGGDHTTTLAPGPLAPDTRPASSTTPTAV